MIFILVCRAHYYSCRQQCIEPFIHSIGRVVPHSIMCGTFGLSVHQRFELPTHLIGRVRPATEGNAKRRRAAVAARRASAAGASNLFDLYIDIRYNLSMLKNLADKTTQDIYDGINSRQARKLPRELHDKARRLLDQINTAPTLDMLRIPPSNRLEKLKGDRAGFWSLRINDQWRIVFRWQGQDTMDVQVIDYH